MMYHVAQRESNAVVVIAEDAYVLILPFYPESQNLKDMFWYMKINAIKKLFKS